MAQQGALLYDFFADHEIPSEWIYYQRCLKSKTNYKSFTGGSLVYPHTFDRYTIRMPSFFL